MLRSALSGKLSTQECAKDHPPWWGCAECWCPPHATKINDDDDDDDDGDDVSSGPIMTCVHGQPTSSCVLHMMQVAWPPSSGRLLCPLRMHILLPLLTCKFSVQTEQAKSWPHAHETAGDCVPHQPHVVKVHCQELLQQPEVR